MIIKGTLLVAGDASERCVLIDSKRTILFRDEDVFIDERTNEELILHCDDVEIESIDSNTRNAHSTNGYNVVIRFKTNRGDFYTNLNWLRKMLFEFNFTIKMSKDDIKWLIGLALTIVSLIFS